MATTAQKPKRPPTRWNLHVAAFSQTKEGKLASKNKTLFVEAKKKYVTTKCIKKTDTLKKAQKSLKTVKIQEGKLAVRRKKAKKSVIKAIDSKKKACAKKE